MIYSQAIDVYQKFVNDFLFAKEIAIPQQELMFLKLEKAHHREFEVQKNYSKTFVFPNISQSIHIFYFSSQQAQRGLLGKQLFLKISVEIFTAIVLLLSATLLKVEVLHRLISSRNNTQQCQSFSCSHRNLFLKVAGVRPLYSKCLKNLCELFTNIKSC